MSFFGKIRNAAREFCYGLEGATIDSAVGEYLSESGQKEMGHFFSENGNRRINSAAETACQVPVIGERLSRRAYSTLSGIRSASRYLGKGVSRMCNT